VSDAAARRRPGGLGRGLSALLGDARTDDSTGPSGGSPLQVEVTRIHPHPDQPRRHFDEDALSELAESIAARGVLQPIMVRPRGRDYELVAGERRWRAAQRAGLTEIPVLVRTLDDTETLEIALIENIQRQDLNAIEEAEAYKRLIEEFGHTQEALGRIVHKSRSHVANLMRLLDLPAPVRAMVSDGRLSMGHARALVGNEQAEALANRAIDRGLTVRDVEALARRDGPVRKGGRANPRPLDADLVVLEQQLGEMIGLPVAVAHNGDGSGQVTIRYASFEQLDLICQRLSAERI
jgi:ParB family transcriptional regulator, chromosome partitioning protein